MIKKIILHKLSGFVMKLSKSLKWIFRRLKRKHKMEVKDKMMKKEWRKFGTKKKANPFHFNCCGIWIAWIHEKVVSKWRRIISNTQTACEHCGAYSRNGTLLFLRIEAPKRCVCVWVCMHVVCRNTIRIFICTQTYNPLPYQVHANTAT